MLVMCYNDIPKSYAKGLQSVSYEALEALMCYITSPAEKGLLNELKNMTNRMNMMHSSAP